MIYVAGGLAVLAALLHDHWSRQGTRVERARRAQLLRELQAHTEEEKWHDGGRGDPLTTPRRASSSGSASRHYSR